MNRRAAPKASPSGSRVLQLISKAESELSAKDIYRALDRHNSLALGSIYRILRELSREGLVSRRQTAQGAVFGRPVRFARAKS